MLPTKSQQSFLGMNITEMPTSLMPTSLMPSSGNGTLIGSQYNSSQSNSNQSSSSENDPTQRLWDLPWFAILSVPLLFATIILPLVIGPSIRWLIQTFLTVRKFWRFSIFPIVPAYLACYYKFLNNHSVVNQVLLSLCDGTVLIIAVLGLWRAVREGTKMKRWASFLLFAIGCTLVNELVVMPFLMGTLPWLMLFIYLLMNHSSIRF